MQNNNNSNFSNVRRRKRGRKQPNSNRKGKINPQSIANLRVPIPKSLKVAMPIPMRFASTLKLNYTVVLQAAASFASIVLKANDWYSPNAALITPGSLIGFTMLSSGYALWRVNRLRFCYSVVANEPAIGTFHAMGLSDTLPVITTLAQATALLGRPPVTRVSVIGETTGMSVFQSPWYDIDLASVVGNPIEFYGSQGFTGVGLAAPASPTQLLYIYLLLFSGTGANLTNGAQVTLQIEYRGTFFSVGNTF